MCQIGVLGFKSSTDNPTIGVYGMLSDFWIFFKGLSNMVRSIVNKCSKYMKQYKGVFAEKFSVWPKIFSFFILYGLSRKFSSSMNGVPSGHG